MIRAGDGRSGRRGERAGAAGPRGRRRGVLAVGRAGGPRAAFSLAELMIAFAILAMGLLVVGAALPIGVRYTQESANLATGEAAAAYALDFLQQNVRLVRTLQNQRNDRVRVPVVFQPRDDDGVFDPDYEPFIKVRPLFVQNVRAGGVGPGNYGDALAADRAEWVIRNTVLPALGVSSDETKECDWEGWLRPALPCVEAVYPPVAPQEVFLPAHFLPPPPSAPYARRPVTDAEAREVLGRLVVWTAFYRRVSYASGSDPNLYELIVVVSRRPTATHRFPLQDESGKQAGARAELEVQPYAASAQVQYGRVDTVVPVPWLVAFDELPIPPYEGTGNGRVLPATFVAPGTLLFTASASVGALLPRGSVFIPAANDSAPDRPSSGQKAGFVPAAPDALPIYRVVSRTQNGDGSYTIEVENPGLYPWVDDSADWWPVWVVPPPIEGVDSARQPLYPDRASILAVARRYVRLHEVPEAP